MPEIGSIWIGGEYNTKVEVLWSKNDTVHYCRQSSRHSPVYIMSLQDFTRLFRKETRLERLMRDR